MSGNKGRHRPTVIPRSQHTVSRANISDNALKVLRRLSSGGYQSFLVGGCVRDLMLGHQPKDFDVATDASPEEVRKLFRNCRLIGRRFRLAHIHFGHEIIEVATFRAPNDDVADDDISVQHDDEGRILRDNRYGLIEDDVWRRDFTANALYYTLDGYAIWDYVGGVDDIRLGIMRLIGDPETRYREDPVRMLRAVRFAAKLDFDIEEASEAPLFEFGELLNSVPAARLFDEVIKIFLTGNAVASMALLERYDLFRHLFPGPASALSGPDSVALKALLDEGLRTTDVRVADNRPVAPFFLFAFLLWGPISARFEELLEGGMPPIPAMQESVEDVLRPQQDFVSIPRRVITLIKETLALQPRFQFRKGVRVLRFLHHPRFRAAYDFMLLRIESGEIDAETAAWWTEIQVLDEAGQRKMAEVGGTGKVHRKRRPRKRRPAAKAKADGQAVE